MTITPNLKSNKYNYWLSGLLLLLYTSILSSSQFSHSALPPRPRIPISSVWKMKPKLQKARKEFLQIRCNMSSMSETMKLLKQTHLDLLKGTPFWPLLEAFLHGLEAQGKHYQAAAVKIIQTFNPQTMSFHFGTRVVYFNKEDIFKILRLPQHGEAVQFGRNSRKLYTSDFTERHFKGIRSKITHTLLHNLLLKLVNGKEKTDIEDVVRITLMDLFVTFLFARPHLSWSLVRYCDEIDNLWRYSWAEAVEEFLNKSLKLQSKFEVVGCVPLILYWFCEQTNIIQPITGREVIEGEKPSLIKWSLPELNRKMQQTTISEIECLLSHQNGVEVETKNGHERQEQGSRHKIEVTQSGHKIEVTQSGHQTRCPSKETGVRVTDPDSVLSVMRKKRKAEKQHAPSDPIYVIPTREIQDSAGKRDEHQVIIIDDDFVSEEQKSLKKEKRPRKECLPFERSEVFKLMDVEYQQKVRTFWNMANPRELLWDGKDTSVYREDVKKIIQDTAIGSNVIDAFMELLEQQQHQNSVKTSTYISTLCWNYVRFEDARKKGKSYDVQDEVLDEPGFNSLVFNPLLRSLAQIDYVFFPIVSKFHYSLLVLDKNEKRWTHYNPFRKRSELHIDPGYEIAKKMHKLIQKWLVLTRKEAEKVLLRGTKEKKRAKKEDGSEVPLHEDEKRTLTWMINQNIDFTLENDRICPQQDFKSLDCGIFVMYYMNQLSKGFQLEEEITERRMWEFRKHLIKLFLDHDYSWKQNSITV